MYVQSRPMCGIYSCHITHHTTQIPPSHILLPLSTHFHNDNNDNGGDGNAKGGVCSNGTAVGRRYGWPCYQHPACGPGVVHVKASTGICTGVWLWTIRGREGKGGVVGNTTWNGECLFNDDREDDKYEDDDKYNDVEDGKGSRRGANNGGDSDTDSCNCPQAVLWQRGA